MLNTALLNFYCFKKLNIGSCRCKYSQKNPQTECQHSSLFHFKFNVLEYRAQNMMSWVLSHSSVTLQSSFFHYE